MRVYRTIDKSAWGEGPWQDEPDKIQWTDEATGLVCLMVRQPTHGAWCGYVGVPYGHPYFEESYQAVNDCLPDDGVHGGLTFDGFCRPGHDEAHGICHVPEPGQPDQVWWLGFDCAHAWDVRPGPVIDSLLYIESAGPDAAYRDVAYVRDQVTKLARLLV